MNRFLLLSAVCAITFFASPSRAQEAVYDPIEPFNRATLTLNNTLDTYLLDPAIVGYRAITPKPARIGLSNFISHLQNPLYFANNLLQGDLTGAATTLKRTVINTFVGFGGVWDVAGENGIKEDAEDFGQTLATWGAGAGPYIVLPILGPSNLRDTSGLIVDGLADPINNYADNVGEEHYAYKRTIAQAVVAKNEVYDAQQDLKKNSGDYYAALRSAYSQYRSAAIADNNDSGAGNLALPDYNVE